jgi:hypothetical protein
VELRQLADVIKQLVGRISLEQVQDAPNVSRIRFATIEEAMKPERALSLLAFTVPRLLLVSQILGSVSDGQL